jgi:hypothetical protein
VQDHELLVMSRECDLLATLAPEPRKRVTDYIVLRSDTLPTIAVVNGAAAAPVDGGLFDQAAEPASPGG